MPSDGDEFALEIPSAGGRHFVVEFPGYVRDEGRALATFGGLAGLGAQRRAHTRNLQLRLRPGDPYSHPLLSDDAVPARCLLLKLTRPRRRADAGGGGCRAEIVASVGESFGFTSPADFQYAGRDLRPEEEQYGGRTAAGGGADLPPAMPRQPLLCGPPVFAVEGPTDYAYKRYRAAEHGVDVLGGRLARRPGAVALVDYFTAEVPAAGPPHGAAPVREALRAASRALEQLLQRRPVILEERLAEELAGATAAAADVAPSAPAPDSAAAAGSPSEPPAAAAAAVPQELLARLCYKFKNGPWAGAWVRRGYDPRVDPEARRYQVLQYSLPADWYAKLGNPGEVAAVPVATSYSQLCSFTALPGTSTAALQLCDLRDERVQEALCAGGGGALREAADDATGWLSLLAWEGIKQNVQQRFQEQLDGLTMHADAGHGADKFPSPVDTAAAPAVAVAAARAARAAHRACPRPSAPLQVSHQAPAAAAAAAAALQQRQRSERPPPPAPGGVLAQIQNYLATLQPAERAALRAGTLAAPGWAGDAARGVGGTGPARESAGDGKRGEEDGGGAPDANGPSEELEHEQEEDGSGADADDDGSEEDEEEDEEEGGEGGGAPPPA